MGLTIRRGKQVAIRAGRAAADTPLVVIAGEPGRGMPWPIVGHWTFDREYAAVEVGDDKEERPLGAGYCSLFRRFPPRNDRCR
jgi:hypothetical protein